MKNKMDNLNEQFINKKNEHSAKLNKLNDNLKKIDNCIKKIMIKKADTEKNYMLLIMNIMIYCLNIMN